MNNKTVEWAVIGAGPAGIAAVGKLIDHGVKPETIVWIDPHFTVGDLGLFWSQVSSNTTVKLFIDFLHAVRAFAYSAAPIDFPINHLPPNDTCELQFIVDPLQWITTVLKHTVQAHASHVTHLSLSKREWVIHTDLKVHHAKNVILATGSVPNPPHDTTIASIPFEQAINKKRLQAALTPTDNTIAVFGSSHSAIIIIEHLVSLNTPKIINFYRSPCRYAVDLGDWTLFDNTGLKGKTAAWAREHIDGRRPDTLIRLISSESNVATYLPQCDKAIYATGFSQRTSLTIEEYQHHQYNPHVGIIGPGLFGLGIAYPERKRDPMGYEETQVGLWKFMTYLNKIMPIWFKYST